MSLISKMKNRNSPIHQFLCGQFSNTQPIVEQCRRRLAGTKTIRPASNVPYGLLDMAFDYRLHYYFALPPCECLVAWRGATLAAGMQAYGEQGVWLGLADEYSAIPWDVCEGFFASLDSLLVELQPIGRRLARSEEDLLARYCVVLALFEEVWRGDGRVPSLLFAPAPEATVHDLLAIAQDHWIEDLRSLSWAFYKQFRRVLSRPAVVDPSFEGSPGLSGADADLIVDGCLIEVKTALEFEDKLPMWLQQLLGYILLDHTDRYRIRAAGLYLARRQAMLQWSLDDLMCNLSGGDPPPLGELRAGFRRVARGPSKEVPSFDYEDAS